MPTAKASHAWPTLSIKDKHRSCQPGRGDAALRTEVLQFLEFSLIHSSFYGLSMRKTRGEKTHFCKNRNDPLPDLC